MSKMTLYSKEYLPSEGVLQRAFSSLFSVSPAGDKTEYAVFPGFCDVHVHFREPGFSYKETIASGSAAAAHGGYTAVCTMPNLSPVPDSVAHLKEELDLIASSARVNVLPYGAITVGQQGKELADLQGMAPFVVAFSDDGHGVQDAELMLRAMELAKSLGKIVTAHCEVNALLDGGYIHRGSYAAAHGHRGISSESEWSMIERDVSLAAKTGCAYHVCHISCKESVDIIRQAKASGVDVTCETAPHYLLLDETNLREDGCFKMNPPLRSVRDREALLEGICDGTIDMIATDHAPHSAEEKARGLEKSAFGIVGLETAFPLLYTYLVKPGTLSLERLVTLLAVAPRRRFGLPFDGDFTVWDLAKRGTVDPATFLSKGKSTPFQNVPICGECLLTVSHGQTAYKKESV